MATSEQTEKFKTREEAASQLAKELKHLRGQAPLILAIPRGAVMMAKFIADELEGDLDLLLVHKLGHPNQLEYAIGAVNEQGDVFITDQESSNFIGPEMLRTLVDQEVLLLHRKRELYTPYRPAIDVQNRTCIIVDDGIATGSTLHAAVKTLKSSRAKRIIVAAPVASRQAMDLLRQDGVEFCILKVPTHFFSVSLHFERFEQVTDQEVINALNDDHSEAVIDLKKVRLNAFLKVPRQAKALIIFAHGSGSSRFSSRHQYIAKRLNAEGYATLLADLLSDDESRHRDNVFDIELLSERVARLIAWSKERSSLEELPIFIFGASTGAAAALKATVLSHHEVMGVISRGGRVDLADEALGYVSSRSLFIVGSLDVMVLDLNRDAMKQMKRAKVDLTVIEGASHLFEEPGTLEQVADEVVAWLEEFKTLPSHNKKENRTFAP